MKNKAPIDISIFVDEKTILWPGIPPVKFEKIKSINRGDMVNDTVMHANVHAGTHIDAPLHFIKDGKSVERIDLKKFLGEAYVVEIFGVKEITASLLQAKLKGAKGIKRLLLKTDNSKLWKKYPTTFYKDYAALTPDAARWVVRQKIDLVGIDYLSIQRFTDDPSVHQILLKAEVIILEGLNLSNVKLGRYELVALPMKLRGLEAASVRAVLFPRK